MRRRCEYFSLARHQSSGVGRTCLVAATTVMLLATHVLASNYTWSGNNSSDWGTKQNWAPANGPPGSADVAIFSTTATSTAPSVNDARAINTITFGLGALTFNIGGTNTLTVNGGGITNNSSNTQTFSLSTLAVGATETWSASTGNLSFTGNSITLGANILTITGGSNTSIADVISGTGSLVKSGAGTLTVAGPSTYSGGTTIKAGTVLIGISNVGSTSGALGTGSVLLGDTTGSNSASLLTNGAFTLSNSITVQAGNTGTAKIGGNTDNNSTFSGAITANHDLTISQVSTTGNNVLTISGGISSGNTGAKTITFAGPGNINVSTNGISNSTGTLAVNVTGGTTTFNVANTYSGATSVGGGTLRSAASNALGGTSGITVSNSGSLVLNASNTINDTATMTLNGNVTGSNPATKNLVVTGSEGSSTDTSATAGLGSLTLQSRSTLDFLRSVNTIVFGQTAGVAFVDSGAFKLDIYNYIGDSTPTGNFDHLVFQQDMSTLTGDFEFWNGSSFIDATAVQLGASSFWEIVPLEPVPEPGTWVAAALSLLTIAFSQQRRFARAIKRAG